MHSLASPQLSSQSSVNLLEVEPGFNGVLSWKHELMTWRIYFAQGRVIFATQTLDPLECLERYLRRLTHLVPELTRSICGQIRQHAEDLEDSQGGESPDYRAIGWTVEQAILKPEAARKLIAWITEESLQSLLLTDPATLQRQMWSLNLTAPLGSLEVGSLLALLKKRLKSWQDLGPTITSPYQRPYFASKGQVERLSSQQQQQLGQLLRGFNFRQLSAMLNQDDLVIARRFAPLIESGILVLRDPQPPFDRLPLTYQPGSTPSPQPRPENLMAAAEVSQNLRSLTQNTKIQSQYTIACIDDSEAMLSEIRRLLGGQNLTLHTINDSLKALMKLTTLKPDLILLDVGMPHVDGYQLCALIRKSSVLKGIPVVMVTGHKGLIDRVRARMAGATDYLTKPFSQDELLQIVFRYLS
ncbi:MAG: response regulator [Cyanophyceae cyanobacterium]